MPKRFAPAPCAVSRAGNLVLCSMKERPSSQTGAFPLSTSTHWAANLRVRPIQNGVRTFTYLLSLSFSPNIIVITLFRRAHRDLAQFGDRQCCNPGPLRAAGMPSSGLVLSPQTPNSALHLLTTVTSGGRKNAVPFLSSPRRPRPR